MTLPNGLFVGRHAIIIKQLRFWSMRVCAYVCMCVSVEKSLETTALSAYSSILLCACAVCTIVCVLNIDLIR